jgi:hypothetical protein
MKMRRLILSSCCASVAAFGLTFLLAALDDAYSPHLPPAIFRFIIAVVDWPFVAVSALLHSDPPPGICWWLLLVVTGLFWGAVTETIFSLRQARTV